MEPRPVEPEEGVPHVGQSRRRARRQRRLRYVQDITRLKAFNAGRFPKRTSGRKR